MPRTKKNNPLEKQKNNNSDAINIVDDTVEDTISSFGGAIDNDDARRDRCILYWYLGHSVTQAGIKAGYSKHYSRGGLHKAFKNGESFRKRMQEIASKLPERFKEISRFRLIDLAEAERRAVQIYLDNPRLLIDKPQLAKHIKAASGVLMNDEAPRQPMVSIEQINILQNMIQKSLDDAVDTEIIETEKIMEGE